LEENKIKLCKNNIAFKSRERGNRAERYCLAQEVFGVSPFGGSCRKIGLPPSNDKLRVRVRVRVRVREIKYWERETEIERGRFSERDFERV
jgi:hypothetical protein